MSRTMYVLTDHQITEEQKRDAVETLGVKEIVITPNDIVKLWSNIPTTMSMEDLSLHIGPILGWLDYSLNFRDVVFIQGDPTATFRIVSAIKSRYYLWLDVRCVASISKMVIEERLQPNGGIEKVTVLKHVRFRSYY